MSKNLSSRQNQIKKILFILFLFSFAYSQNGIRTLNSSLNYSQRLVTAYDDTASYFRWGMSNGTHTLYIPYNLSPTIDTGGISNLNGLNQATQLFAIDTSVSSGAPTWSSVTATHTLRLPFARMKDTSFADGVSKLTGYAPIVITKASKDYLVKFTPASGTSYDTTRLFYLAKDQTVTGVNTFTRQQLIDTITSATPSSMLYLRDTLAIGTTSPSRIYDDGNFHVDGSAVGKSVIISGKFSSGIPVPRLASIRRDSANGDDVVRFHRTNTTFLSDTIILDASSPINTQSIILLDASGGTSYGRIQRYNNATRDIAISQNVFFTGTVYNKDATTRPAQFLELNQGTLSYVQFPSGANPSTRYFTLFIDTLHNMVLGNTTSATLTNASNAKLSIKNDAVDPYILSLYSSVSTRGAYTDSSFNTFNAGYDSTTGKGTYGDTIRSGNYTTYSYFIPGGALVQSSDSTLKKNILPFTANLANFKLVQPRTYNFKKETFIIPFDEKSVPDSIEVQVDSVTVKVSNKATKDAVRAEHIEKNNQTAERLASVNHSGFLAKEFNQKLFGKDSKEIRQEDVINVMWAKIQELEGEKDKLKTRIESLEKK